MRFCVNTCIPDPNGTVTLSGTYYDGSYEILDNGAVVITPDDRSEDVVTYSPHFWVSVERPGPDHLAAADDRDILDDLGDIPDEPLDVRDV